MAEIPMSALGTEPAAPRSGSSAVNLVGAVVSLALIAGAGVWGYKLMVRDVSGVPVVRAVEGPMRVQPDDPGGRQAENQGLSVNDVAAAGAAAAPADRLVLAPPPISLTEEDEAVTLTSLPSVSTQTMPRAARNTPRQRDVIAPPPLDNDNMAAINELADRLAAGAEPLSGEAPGNVTPPKLSLGTTGDTVPDATETTPVAKPPVAKGGVAYSLRPQMRPSALAAGSEVRLASADASQVAPTPVAEASDVPPGTRLVQLGAYASEEIARNEWYRLNGRFGDYLGDKTRVVQKAKSGGKVFYRLRAMGFSDLSDARRLCSALKAEGADCIPVVAR